MNTATPPKPQRWSWRQAKHRLAHSIKLRLVLVFLLLAAAMTFVFITGAQKAFSLGWREAARPLLMDYVNRLTADISPDAHSPPNVERAQAITQRLPLTIDIAGPQVNWQSHPGHKRAGWQRDGATPDNAPSRHNNWGGSKDWPTLLTRTTADGHTIEFGINEEVFERRPRLVGYALAALLVLTLLAWWYVRRLLKPLDAIGEGARRFGAGDFSQPIPQRCLHGPDELGELAATLNTMGEDIRQMLDAKRALLLAISHELRSPLTRARLNTELLPEHGRHRPPARRPAARPAGNGQPHHRPAGKRTAGRQARSTAMRAGGSGGTGARGAGRPANPPCGCSRRAAARRPVAAHPGAGPDTHAPAAAQPAGQRLAPQHRRAATARAAPAGHRASTVHPASS
jgi:signal transduction histidine kinase